VGGGTTSRLWPQIVSDVTGVSQDLPRERSGASYGDAKFAAVALGVAKPETVWNRPEATVEPAPEARAVYDERYGLYHELREATTTVQHGLARRS
jgi:xylulokinase